MMQLSAQTLGHTIEDPADAEDAYTGPNFIQFMDQKVAEYRALGYSAERAEEKAGDDWFAQD